MRKRYRSSPSPGIQTSNLAGNFVSQQIRLLYSQSQPAVPLTPHYLVTSKSPVDAGAPASATYRTFEKPPHESFRRHEEERVLTEFKESVVQVWGGPGRLSGAQQGTPNEEVIKAMPGRPFEMPDGWNQVFGPERFRVAEGIFDSKMAFHVRTRIAYRLFLILFSTADGSFSYLICLGRRASSAFRELHPSNYDPGVIECRGC